MKSTRTFSIQLLLFCFCFATVSWSQNTTVATDSLQSNNKIYNDQYLLPFYNKLKKIKTNGETVSILQLGDSHMQMGYFTDEMRNHFSSQFGMSSIGNIFPYPIASYKPFYIKTKVLSGIWEGRNHLKPEDDFKFGFTGFAVKTVSKNASLEIMPRKYQNEIATGNQVTIYFTGDDTSTIEIIALNTVKDSTLSFKPSKIIFNENSEEKNGWKKIVFNFDSQINKIVLTVNQSKVLAPFYINGVFLNNTEKGGIIYNNCGVGGAQFSSLCNNSSLSISQIKDLNPDLIIFSYGSNESYTKSFTYENYIEMVRKYITTLKVQLPNTTILLTSPPDTRSNDRYPINTKPIGLVFNALAKEQALSYWDMTTQMGGDGSLFKWLKLGLAAKDKLHFTKQGYALQADLLLEALFSSYNSNVTDNEKVNLPIITTAFK